MTAKIKERERPSHRRPTEMPPPPWQPAEVLHIAPRGRRPSVCSGALTPPPHADISACSPSLFFHWVAHDAVINHHGTKLKLGGACPIHLLRRLPLSLSPSIKVSFVPSGSVAAVLKVASGLRLLPSLASLFYCPGEDGPEGMAAFVLGPNDRVDSATLSAF